MYSRLVSFFSKRLFFFRRVEEDHILKMFCSRATSKQIEEKNSSREVRGNATQKCFENLGSVIAIFSALCIIFKENSV